MATQQKVLLLEDVEELGRSGDIVGVKPGYARNYLVPRRKAVRADRNAIRMQERLQEERQKKAAEDRKEAEALAAKLNGQMLKTEVKVDPDGHMYGSVSGQDLLHLLEEQLKVTLDRKAVRAFQTVKKVGVFDVELKLKEEVTAEIKLKVIAEGAIEEEAPEEAATPDAAESSESETEAGE